MASSWQKTVPRRRHLLDAKGMTTQAITLRDLRKTFPTPEGPLHAVDGISLSVRTGEVAAFLGRNGAGKTTTLDMVLGFTRPTSGTVEVFGMAPREAVVHGRTGAVLQSGGLLDDLTVSQTMEMVAALHGPVDIDDALRRAGADHITTRKVGKCSGGEQQRLRFALALLPNPDLLILDEPTAGMDVSARRDFWDTMRAETSRGRTVVFATHYLDEAEEFADHVIVIDRGTIVADGTTDDIRGAAGASTLSCRWNPSDGDPAGLPHLLSHTLNGNHLTCTSSDTDALARHLLTRTSASQLAISRARLEDAFVDLTSGKATS